MQYLFQESVGERGEYDQLMQWLDGADDTLTIVDRPVHDLQQEYQVCGTALLSVSTTILVLSPPFFVNEWSVNLSRV